MKIFFVFTGKTSDRPLAELLAEYKSRISRYAAIEIHEIKTVNEKNESAVSIKQREQKEQIKSIHEKDFLVLLDERGKEYSSVEFSVQLEKWNAMPGRRLVFMTGGAYGFGEEILRRADAKISFSRFTFTHQMIRVLLLEQVYRAFTIINRQQYHH
jgi:23S rRNA (pseudouridine1915-N3)-methyltransferase